MEQDQTCQEQVGEHYESRIDTIRDLWELHQRDPEAYHDDHGTNFDEYGLSVDYVESGTKYNPDEGGYIRYQLSWGGPADEFRFFIDAQHNCYKVEYWFLDWGDGAKRHPRGDDEALLLEIFDSWRECGMIEHWVREGTE